MNAPQQGPAAGISSTPIAPRNSSRWIVSVAAILFLGVAATYAYYIVFSRPMSPDEGYLMITIQSFIEGNALYDSVFTHYGPFYYFYEWVLRVLMSAPLSHDATRMLCIVHWLTASVVLGLAGRAMTRSVLAGAFVFVQAMVHLTAIASEPGHPQELVVVLLALGMWAATRESQRFDRLAVLAVITALLVFTKINVGIFFSVALLLAMRFQAGDRFARDAWGCLLIGVCAAAPFVLMRHHLSAEWCRNCSLVAAGSIVASLLVAQNSSKRPGMGLGQNVSVAIFFFAPSAVLLGIAALTGTSVKGLIDGLFLTPLKMAHVALLPLPLSNVVLLNTAVSVAMAAIMRRRAREPIVCSLVTILKALYAIAGSLWLIRDAKAQFAWLLPWVWLVLVPPDDQPEQNWSETFPRLFLCLAATWQGLQAYPIAGTQVTTATILLVLACTVCLCDALRAAVVRNRIKEQIARLSPRSLRLAQVLAGVGLLYVFAGVWCKLPEVRRHYASLPALGLPGSLRVHFDSETTEMYRELAQYLEAECDTFVTYPGINSLYFWTGKRPPTHLNSTGWGQLSYQQQEQILAALWQARRPKLVVVAAATQGWRDDPPPPIRPLVQHVFGECREIKRIGRFIIFVPAKNEETAQRD
jgi:hypothetical protein